MKEKENFVLCGDKKKYLEIPEGYEIVSENDKNDIITEQNINNFKVANVRHYHWMSLDREEDLGLPVHMLGDNVIKKQN